MAAPEEAVFPPKLSHKKYRAALKKERRKKRRQELARLRDSGLSPEEEDEDAFTEEQLEEEKSLERERQKLHEEWLLRRQQALEEFRIKKEKEEAARKRQEERERKLKEEWEEQQRKEREEEQQELQERREREEARQRTLEQAEHAAVWHNPEPPVDLRVMEKDRANCPFYSKTGACRFGDRCSRKHNFPASSPTLLIKSMFTTFGMEQCRRDDYDPDAGLEYSEEETYQQFLDFYDDVLPEFKNVGRVIKFKVSCNLEPHLRGNVYVQYQSEEECQTALSVFNGRWYAGRQLQCEFCPVTRWKMAICGLFEIKQCPRGRHCNFLHVFRNPNNEFWEAERDVYLSPDKTGSALGKSLERRGRTSHPDEYGRLRRRSPSPDPSYKRNEESERKRNDRGKKSHKRKSKSRERRSSRNRGSKRFPSRSRGHRSHRSRRSRRSRGSHRSHSHSSSRSRSRGPRRSRSSSRDRTAQSPKSK
ncbi:U2 small nuclear ribonucleoprotein auxiliary factor 35 kDa subunit-related protein 2-like [Nycticebus coucang]|uniref:U2 small nuclear ribonucleoprotein auxiliary factor 35 kDa subunit-related protein 2-like n=1 Tax=Nycticebus coucang TaxID=9470 RepID=UPI00234D2310|nr:U2 small nuclear ribonucleoprotein auxiliary factor 35 kDa subunit-related protein 2-like [Nycticebus coucang]